ncbi:MAG: MoxR family ATPase [Bacteroidota bacterium]
MSRNIQLPSRRVNLRDIPAQQYVLDDPLADAVEVALALQLPLLITGAPGTGKTRLAWRVAADLHAANPDFLPEPLEYTVKTTAIAQDLLYHYDALSHFHDANLKGADSAPSVAGYIELRALGKAIALANPTQARPYLRSEKDQQLAQRPRSSVVLIDEIDKAPSDFPNDLLTELDRFTFRIREDGNQEIKLSPSNEQRVVVILTSNSEKTLPEAFLRRCVFYHIAFPDSEQLQHIVQARLPDSPPYHDQKLVEHFLQLRKRVRRKQPATSELIDWLKILELHDFLSDDQVPNFEALTDTQRKTLRLSYSVLAKTEEDLKELLKQA